MVIRSQGLQLIEWRSWGWNKQEAVPSIYSIVLGICLWGENTVKRGESIQSSNRETHMQFTICIRITVHTMSCLLVCGFHHQIHPVIHVGSWFLFFLFISFSEGCRLLFLIVTRKWKCIGKKGNLWKQKRGEEIETVQKKENERWVEKSKGKGGWAQLT